MELKCLCGFLNGNSTTFKSHLYGIEIELYHAHELRSQLFKSHLYGIEIFLRERDMIIIKGLNRTFMELKFAKIDKSHYILSFKSHLYGIEIQSEKRL